MKNISQYVVLLVSFILLSCEHEKWNIDIPAQESIYELREIASGNDKIDLIEVYRSRPLMIRFVSSIATALSISDFVDNSTNTNFDFSFKITSNVAIGGSDDELSKRIDEYNCIGSKLDGKSKMNVISTIGTSTSTKTYTLNISEKEKYTPKNEEYHYKVLWDSSAVNEIKLDTFLTFSNKSEGFKYQEWIIEEGNHFLKNNFNVEENLYQQIIEGLSSNEKTVNILFGKSGMSTVSLRIVYDKPVALEDGSLRAIKDDNSDDWVILKNFQINVSTED